jgi:hypothetical protein
MQYSQIKLKKTTGKLGNFVDLAAEGATDSFTWPDPTD